MPASKPLLPEFLPDAFPRWALVRHRVDDAGIADATSAVAAALEPVTDLIAPGMRVCLTGGSRGIDRIDEVTRAVVAWVRAAGALPFIVPAMGSHGGATPVGQLAILEGYGITAQTMGCEIRATMDTVHLGEVEPGIPVYLDRNAAEGADLIIPINRVKPHTGFTAATESGLQKMIAIGLGKQKGADVFHRQGYARFGELIPKVARHTMERAPIRFGLALVEDGHSQLAHVEAVRADSIRQREVELLAMARSTMARLPIDVVDVLVVDEIGKDISGVGMDPNVVGRGHDGLRPGGPTIQRIVVRGLTEATEGNACGIGMAEFALRRAVDAMDPRKTWMNEITAKTPEGGRTPIALETDREALAVAIAACVGVEVPTARVIRVRSTKDLELLLVSEAALPDVLATGRCEVVVPLAEIAFNEDGMFVRSALEER
ncbi:MAG: lactate racemase domain-containing protein [Chloroflexota bacterium]